MMLNTMHYELHFIEVYPVCLFRFHLGNCQQKVFQMVKTAWEEYIWYAQYIWFLSIYRWKYIQLTYYLELCLRFSLCNKL